jgi:hypothetical protein
MEQIMSITTTPAVDADRVRYIMCVGGTEYRLYIVGYREVGPFSMVQFEAHCTDAPYALGFELERGCTLNEIAAELKNNHNQMEV